MWVERPEEGTDMPDTKRVIFFSNRAESARPMAEALGAAGFDVLPIDDAAVLMREARSAGDRVVLLDFASQGVCGLEILREIKYLDGSIQVVVLNAEPRVYVGIEIFRLGAEACFFAPAPESAAELVVVIEAAFVKVTRWWRILHDVAAKRPPVEPGPAGGHSERGATGISERQPLIDEEVELVDRALRVKGRIVATTSAGADVMIQDAAPPALLDKVFVRFRGNVLRALVRRLASDPAGGWRVGLEWNVSSDRLPALAGARAELAMFVTLDGWRVVARGLTAVDKDVVSARLASGRVHAVPTQSIRSMTRAEREAELLAAPDISGLAGIYQLDPLADRKATVQAIMAIEFAVIERGS
jgi:DNA-binding response OmpR family regulator